MRKKGVPDWFTSLLWSKSNSIRTRSASGSSPSTHKPEIRNESETENSPIAGGDLTPLDGSEEEISGQSLLFAEVSKKVISLGELRRLALQGIPDGAGVRSIVWKLLLGYLPNDHAFWEEEVDRKRSQYNTFKDEFLLNPDTEVIEQIDRDVMRTHPDMHFFSGDSSLAKSNRDSLKQILIIFAKLNPGIRYVQGMNEVLAPLYYVFRNDPDEKNAVCAEADAFFCFVELLSGFRDNFCQKLDNSAVGIRSTISKLSNLLKKHDVDLWRHLEFTTKETLLRICCAMLILVRRRLLAGDFTSNLKLLQHYPWKNISHLLYVANKLRGPSSSGG